MAKKKKTSAAIDIEVEQDYTDGQDSAPSKTPIPVVTDILGPVDKKSVTAEPKIEKASPVAKPRAWPVWAWVVVGAVGLGGAAALGFVLMNPSSSKTATNKKQVFSNTNQATLVTRKLDGVLVPVGSDNPNIFAIMIENASDSRPPSGLDKASVVYEALAEGGITRFMGLFPVGQGIAEIGPVRSARQYFVEWAEEYRPLYVHAGGSPESLTYLQSRNTNVIDFNQFRHGPNFIRDKTRRAPHNLYSSTDLLYVGLKTIAPEAVPNFAAWTFQDEPPLDSRAVVVNDTIIDFSSFNYKVTYKYDRVMNQYQRYQGEVPHVNRDNNNIFAKNIVVQFTKTRATGDAAKRLDIETLGEGAMMLFRDGKVIEGTWKKSSPTARTEWRGSNGNPMALNRGSIWVAVLPTDRKVVY